MVSRITYMNVRSGTGQIMGGNFKNLEKRLVYSAFTQEMLPLIKCLPDNIRAKMRIISFPVHMPTVPLEAALGKIGLDTRVSCSNYSARIPRYFRDAIDIFTQHLKAPDAVIGVSLAAAVDPGGNTWPGAPIQLNFYKLLNERTKDLSREIIRVNLDNMSLVSQWTKKAIDEGQKT